MKVLSALVGAVYHHFDRVSFLGMIAFLAQFRLRLKREARAELLQIIGLLWLGAYLAAAKRPGLAYGPSRGARRSAQTLLHMVPELNRTFYPSLLGGGLLNSILCKFIRPLVLPTPKEPQGEVLRMEDGGLVKLVWMNTASRADRPVLLLFPGNLGGSDASYLLGLVHMASQRDWRAVVYHRRGCGKLELGSPHPQNFADVQDTMVVVAEIKRRFPAAPLLGVGFSLGGNQLVKTLAFMAAHTDGAQFVAAAVLGVPYDLVAVSHWLANSARLVELALISDCKELVRSNRAMLETSPHTLDLDRVLAANTYRELVAELHCKLFGYPAQLDEYLIQSGSYHVLENVNVPLLCIHADDDPVVPHSAVPFHAFEKNAKLLLAHHVTGGHHGFVGLAWNGPSWSDRAVVQWLEAALRAEQSEEAEGGKMRRVQSF